MLDAVDESGRVSDKRNLARTTVAISAAAVAACAITLTIQAMTTGIAVTRVLDQEALERQVAKFVSGESDRDIATCPVSVEAKKGNQFTCEAPTSDGLEKVYVKVTSDQGELELSFSRH